MVTHLRRALETGPPETVLDALVKLARSAEAALALRRAIGLDPFKFRATKKSDRSCDRAEGIRQCVDGIRGLRGTFSRGLLHATNADSRPGRGAGEMTALGVEAFSNA